MLLRIPGVYGPFRDSELLAEVIPDHVERGERTLDLFTGTGIQAIAAGRAGAGDVWAVDISRRAVASAAINGRLNGVRVNARRGDMFAPVAGQSFDVITANPPYVPEVKETTAATRGAARAWEAGADGRRFLDPLLAELQRHLRPGGRALIVHSSLCGIERSLKRLGEAGFEAEVILSESAPLGPITAPRADALERLGLLEPGVRTEETIVIRALLRAAVPASAPELALASA
jgi:release factor glutamine methyltransferase